MCFFDGTEGILTVLPRVQIWCTVAGLIWFLVSLKRIVPFLALFDVIFSLFVSKINFNSLQNACAFLSFEAVSSFW